MSDQKEHLANTNLVLDGNEKKKRKVPTYEERMQRVNERQRDMLLKNLKTQVEIVSFTGFRNHSKLKSALQGLKSIITGIEAAIEPELPYQ